MFKNKNIKHAIDCSAADVNIAAKSVSWPWWGSGQWTPCLESRVPCVEYLEGLCVWGLESNGWVATVRAHVCALWHLAEQCMICRGTWNHPELGSNHTFNTCHSGGTEKSPNSFEVRFSHLWNRGYMYIQPCLDASMGYTKQFFLLSCLSQC